MDSRALELDAQIKRLSERFEGATGKNIRCVNAVKRGYTTAHRLIVEFSDGTNVFVSLGLCSLEWLETALPVLMEAEKDAVLDGKELVHLDIRSDNICFVGDRVVLVDWNWELVGCKQCNLR